MAERSQARLGQEPVGKLLFEYALPSVIATSIAALNNFVDTLFIGRYVGEVAVAATTVALPVMLLIAAIGMWIGVGGTANGAIKLGEGKKEEAERFLASNLTLLLIAALVIIVLGNIFLEPFLRFCGATDSNMAFSKAFSTVLIFGTVLQLPGLGMNNFIRTDGSPNIALFTMVAGGITNIILNFVFVAKLEMGIAGSALATVIGQGFTSLLVIRYFTSSKAMLKLRRKYLKPEKRIIIATLQLGLSSFALQVAAAFINVFINSQITYFGAQDPIGADGGLAVIGTVVKIANLFVMPVIGISIANQPILGFNYGAKKYTRVERAFLLGWISSTIMITVFWLFIQIKPEVIIALFKLPPDLSEFGARALRLFMAFMPLIPLQILGSNYFQSTGQPLKSLLLSLTRQLILLVPFTYIFPRFIAPNFESITPLQSIVLATPAADSISIMIVAAFLFTEFKKLRRKVREEQELHPEEA